METIINYKSKSALCWLIFVVKFSFSTDLCIIDKYSGCVRSENYALFNPDLSIVKSTIRQNWSLHRRQNFVINLFFKFSRLWYKKYYIWDNVLCKIRYFFQPGGILRCVTTWSVYLIMHKNMASRTLFEIEPSHCMVISINNLMTAFVF